MAPATIIEKPSFPANFPEEKKAAWQKSFDEAMEQAQVDNAGAFAHQTARKEANRHLRVPVPKSHADAMRLEEWQVLSRKEVSADKVAALGYEPQGSGPHVAVVTIDGKKYFFAKPEKRTQEKEPEQKQSEQKQSERK